MAERRVISKKSLIYHRIVVGTIRSYSDGSATCTLKKDRPLVQAMFNTLVDVVTEKGFVQDPESLHIFHYQLPVDEVDEANNINDNDEESTHGTDQAVHD